MLENNLLFGIPIQLIAGFGSYLLALLFWNLWPKSKAAPYNGKLSWPGYILHYFHPLAWVLLGTASFMQASNPVLGGTLAGLGGIVYFIFIIIMIRS